MLDTSKNVLFPGHNHLLTTGSDDPILCISLEWWVISVRSSVPGRLQAVMTWKWALLEVASIVVTWWRVGFFLAQCNIKETIRNLHWQNSLQLL